MLPTEQTEDFPALRCSLTANSAPTATPGHAPARPGLVRMRVPQSSSANTPTSRAA